MNSRLFLGVKVGAEHHALLKGTNLKLTTREEKTYYGYVISPKTTLAELKEWERKLLQELDSYFPGVRFPKPLLFPELLIG